MTARVLVVDDIEANRRLIQAKLEARYYSVELADSGQAAIDCVLADQPDIVLLDVMMPGMDGYEVCRLTKSSHPGIPVLLLVGTFEQFDEAKAAEVGADGHNLMPRSRTWRST